MTPTLADLRALAEAATPGLWSNNDGKRGPKKSVWVAESHREMVDSQPAYPGQPSRYGPDRKYVANVLDIDDAAFVAACSPPTILALLDRVERAEATAAASQVMNDDEEKRWSDDFCAVTHRADANERKLREAESTIARLTSEVEALRALVPSEEERSAVVRMTNAYELIYSGFGAEARVKAVRTWLQRIEAARAAEGGG